MKNYFSKLFILLACVSFLFTSCNKDAEGELYNSGELAVSFASTVQQEKISDAKTSKVLVPVYRANAAGEAVVKVSLTEKSGLFKLASTDVKFVDGQNVAFAEVTFAADKLQSGVKYESVLSIVDQKLVSVSGDGQLKLIVVR